LIPIVKGLEVEVVVFDLDDTLYLERDFVRSGFREVASVHRLADFERVAWSLFLNGVRGKIFDRTLDVLGITYTGELIGQLVCTYRQHLPDIALLEDASIFLHNLKEHKVPIAVITDGPLVSQTHKIDALNVRQYVDLTIFTDAYGVDFAKPHPRSFEEVQSWTRYPPSAHIYIADNPAKDFVAPLSLGWKTMRVRRMQSLHVDAQTPKGIDSEIMDFDQLRFFK
jgi:putative hydrolase of the HAD superfamily